MQVEQLIDSRILEYARIREQLAAVAGKIERAERNAARLRDETVTITVKGTHQDGTLGRVKVTGRPGREYGRELRAMERFWKQYAHLDAAQWDALEAAEDAITAVPSAEIRLLLRLRFLDGMTWYDIAMKRGKTPTWPKITLERYFIDCLEQAAAAAGGGSPTKRATRAVGRFLPSWPGE